MIRLNELRIGNLFNTAYNEVFGVGGVIDQEMELAGWENQRVVVSYGGDFYKAEEIMPIPVSEEWLLKCGFEDLGTKSKMLKGVLQLDIDKNQVLIMKEGRWELLANVVGQGGTVFPCPQIKHIHQLQNLYFILSGDELKIK